MYTSNTIIFVNTIIFAIILEIQFNYNYNCGIDPEYVFYLNVVLYNSDYNMTFLTFLIILQIGHTGQLGPHSKTNRSIFIHWVDPTPIGVLDSGVPHLPIANRPHQCLRLKPL